MAEIVEYFKTHKIVFITLVLVFAYLLFKPNNPVLFNTKNYDMSIERGQMISAPAMPESVSGVVRDSLKISPVPNPSPIQLNVKDRKFVTNSSLSLVVKNVKNSLNDIESKVLAFSGIVLNKTINAPEMGDSGYISVRVPVEKTKEALDAFKGMSVKVVYENTNGNDVTDQYYDSQARLATLEKNKKRFEEIMDAATKTEDILNIQNQIFQLQDQIDSIKGQLKYVDETSKTVLITVNLSTDELSLPYAPEKSWRPEVILKEAVRSLFANLRGIGAWVIWILVYSLFWGPVVLVYIGYKIFKKNKETVSVSK